FVAQIKGGEPQSLLDVDHQGMLYAGSLEIARDSIPTALIGAQIQANLRVPIDGFDNSIQLFSPPKGTTGTSINPIDDSNIRQLSPSVFSIMNQGSMILLSHLSHLQRSCSTNMNMFQL